MTQKTLLFVCHYMENNRVYRSARVEMIGACVRGNWEKSHQFSGKYSFCLSVCENIWRMYCTFVPPLRRSWWLNNHPVYTQYTALLKGAVYLFMSVWGWVINIWSHFISPKKQIVFLVPLVFLPAIWPTGAPCPSCCHEQLCQFETTVLP